MNAIIVFLYSSVVLILFPYSFLHRPFQFCFCGTRMSNIQQSISRVFYKKLSFQASDDALK